jgi:pimeloyl-ACP methyl ester carboxylesterase/DNA-binding CsgD family transcriptional regulator
MKQQIRFTNSYDGVRIAYATSGSGPPLVKVANWLSHLEFDRNSPVWAHWLAELSSGFTLIRYDERGCGLSDWEVTDFSLEAWVRDLEMVVDALNLERFPLLALSQGGAVAIAYAARHPERVSHLILVGAFARGFIHQNESPRSRELYDTLTQMIGLGWGKSNPAFRQVFTSFFIPDATPDQATWFNDLMRVSTSPENAVRFHEAFNTLDVQHLAPKVIAPTLVLHAQQDSVVRFRESRLLASLIPGARFVPLHSRNHVLLADEPAWPMFLAEVRDFLGEGQSAGVRSAPGSFPELTDRELEVLDLIAQGLGNTEIAEQLVISPSTLRNHITSIFSKLDVTNRAQAIVLARESGFGQRP